jgi:hypothetical protein
MTTVYNPKAQFRDQCSNGLRVRNVNTIDFIVAHERTNNVAPARIMADVIAGETEIKGVFIAPCACKVVRIWANGTPFIDNDVLETSTVKLTKAVIGGSNVDLCSNITIGSATAPTSDTPIDATLSTTSGALDLIDGQHVYATITVDTPVETAVAYITVGIEWVPVDINP